MKFIIRISLVSLVFCVSAFASDRVETVRFQSKLVREILKLAAQKMRLPPARTSKVTRTSRA